MNRRATETQEAAARELLREVEEDLGKEKLQSFWQNYGNTIIALLIVIVLATAGKVGWEHHVRTRNIESSATFLEVMKALENGDHQKAATLFENIRGSGKAEFVALAGLKAAEGLEGSGKEAEAAALYSSIAGNAKPDNFVAQLALLHGAVAAMEKKDWEAAQKAISTLAKPESPLHATGIELKALLALEQDNKQEAVNLYAQLENGLKIPPSLRARSREMLAALKAEGFTPATAASTEPTTATE